MDFNSATRYTLIYITSTKNKKQPLIIEKAKPSRERMGFFAYNRKTASMNAGINFSRFSFHA